jgi:Domain of unknown function (DUF2341)
MVARSWVGALLVASVALLACSSPADGTDVSGASRSPSFVSSMQTGGSWSIFASGSAGVASVTAGAGGATAGASQAGIAHDWYDDSFERRRPVTADPRLGADEALCDFPVPMALPAGTFEPGSVRPDGADLRFADAAGEILRHEVELWDANGDSLVWVRFPKLPLPTAIHMYYGSPDKASVADVVKPTNAAETDVHTPIWIAAQAQVADGTSVSVGPEQQR